MSVGLMDKIENVMGTPTEGRSNSCLYMRRKARLPVRLHHNIRPSNDGGTVKPGSRYRALYPIPLAMY